MIRLLLCLFIVFFPFIYKAQDIYKTGARSAALSNASVALDDVWAYHHNPGMVGFANAFGAGVHYENRYFLRELQYQGITLVQPLKIGVLSAGGQYSGFNLYSSTRAGMGYSMRLSEKLAAGVQLNYLNIRQPAEYGVKHGISAEFGLAAIVNKEWTIGASVYNISRTRFASYQDERFSTIMRIGATYSVSSKVKWLMEIEKDIVAAVRLKGAVEYEPVTDFFIRLGAASSPLEYSFGFGYTFQWLRIDLASSYKQLLGFSTGVSLQFLLNKS